MDVAFELRSWNCSNCYHLNLPGIDTCECCGNINPISPAATSREPYWYCHHCYSGNPQQRSYCRACHTIRQILITAKADRA